MPTASDPMRLLPGGRLKAAFLVAIVADLVQMVAFPLFLAGAASPVDDATDLATFALLTWLVGWHWEFTPSFLGELLPGLDLMPLWSLAMFNVYRKERQKAAARLAGMAGKQ